MKQTSHEAKVTKMRKTLETLNFKKTLVLDLSKRLELLNPTGDGASLKKELGSANKSVIKAQKALDTLAHLNPEVASEVGYTVTSIRTLVRVYEYGALCSPVVLNEAPDAGITQLDRQMRLRHEYWNRLVTMFEPFKQEILSLAGPVELKYREISKQIESISTNIGKLKSEHGLSKSKDNFFEKEEFLTLRDARAALIKAKQELVTEALAERRKSRYIQTTALILKKMGPHQNKVRKSITKGVNGGGLYQGNYLDIDQAFMNASNAFVKELDGYKHTLHFKYESILEAAPQDLLTFNKWNGDGTVSIQTGNSKADQAIETVLNGKNSRFQLSPITPEDLNHFGSKLKIDLNRKSSNRIYLAKLRIQSEGPGNRTPVWAMMPIILHRPLPEGGSITDASFTVVKDSLKTGKRRKFKLTVGVKLPYSIQNDAKATATVTLTNEESKGPFGSFDRTEDTAFQEFLGTDTLPWAKDGTLTTNSRILGAEKFSKDKLIPIMEQADREIKNYINAGLSENRRLPDWFKNEGISLYRTNKHGYSIITVGAVFHTFKKWRRRLIAEAGSESKAKQVQTHLKVMRDLAVQRFQELERTKEIVSENWIVLAHQKAWDYAVEEMGISNNDAWLLALLTFFVARHEHLLRYIDGTNRRARNRRKHEYRVFAYNFLKGVKVLTLRQTNFQTRNITEEQKSFCKSDFERALRNVAEREGIEIINNPIEKKKKIKKIG